MNNKRDYLLSILTPALSQHDIALMGLSFHIKELVGNLNFSFPGQLLNGHTFVSPNKSNSVGENHIGQDR